MSDLEFQAASLSLREWALWVAIVQVGISAAQTGIVYYGIRAMIRAADQRGRDAERDRTERAEAAAEARREAADARREADRRHAEAMQAAEAARREADRRHAEAMQAAADARRESAEAAEAARRESDRRHAEAMQASAERHAENMAAVNAMAATLAETTAALKVVVERTAPAPAR